MEKALQVVDYLVMSKGCRTVEHPETENREDGSVDVK